MVYKHILLASFVPHEKLDAAFEQISRVADVERCRIFVFRAPEIEDYIFTYNIQSDHANEKFSSIWPDTISIHRKKETNTLFSLNALNELIKSENGGQLIQSYKVVWENYRNCFLLFRNGHLAVLQLELIKLNR
jgi:hypothetical protein